MMVMTDDILTSSSHHCIIKHIPCWTVIIDLEMSDGSDDPFEEKPPELEHTERRHIMMGPRLRKYVALLF